jgi:hypothetical protein
MNDEILREKARQAIRSGKLPTRKPARRLGGLGRGGVCAVCGERLTPTQMEIEIEFNRHGSTPGLDTHQLHPRCFAAWEFEIHSRLDQGSISSRDPRDPYHLPPGAAAVEAD